VDAARAMSARISGKAMSILTTIPTITIMKELPERSLLSSAFLSATINSPRKTGNGWPKGR